MRPDEAKRLYEDPVLKEGFSLLREKYRKDFETAKDDELHRIRLKFDLIRDFYSELMKIINEEALHVRANTRTVSK